MTLKKLEKEYWNYKFDGGAYVTPEYKSFERKYINYLKNLAKTNNWEVVNVSKGHFEFSLFFRNEENKYIYFSISDVRFWHNEWYDDILVRTAHNEQDYHGGSNHFTTLPELETIIQKLFN